MEIVQLIERSSEGSRAATDQLFQLVYEDLKKLSRKLRFNWRNENTLNTTALVHEAYLKVCTNEELSTTNKLHFYRICGRAMKYILQDSLKLKNAAKRGGA